MAFAKRAGDVSLEMLLQHRVVAPILIGACVALAGCGGGGGSNPPGPQNVPPPVITFSHAYPAHQVMATNGTPWMITNIATTLSGAMYIGGADLYDTLRVDVTISPYLTIDAFASPGQSGGFGVQIAIDSDGNPATGGLGSCVIGTPGTPFDYDSINSPRLTDGNYSIFSVANAGIISNGGSNPPGEAVTSVTSSTVSQSFYLPSIHVFSGKSVPHIGIQVAAFNGLDLLSTDCQPSTITEQFTDR